LEKERLVIHVELVRRSHVKLARPLAFACTRTVSLKRGMHKLPKACTVQQVAATIFNLQFGISIEIKTIDMLKPFPVLAG